MMRRTVNGVIFVNYCTSSYTDSFADSFVKSVKAGEKPDYIDAFHESGFIWVACKDDNEQEQASLRG